MLLLAKAKILIMGKWNYGMQACYDKYMILSRNEGVDKANGKVVDLSHGEG